MAVVTQLPNPIIHGRVDINDASFQARRGVTLISSTVPIERGHIPTPYTRKEKKADSWPPSLIVRTQLPVSNT